MNYYVLEIGSAEKGESGEQCGSKYDHQAACKVCGTGAKLKGKLFTKGLKKVKDEFFSTLNVDLLISNDIFSILGRDGIVLNDASEVSDYRGNPLPFYHLNPRHSFPKMLPQSEGLVIENQCQVCRQNGYFNDVVSGNLQKGIRTFVKPLVFHYQHIEATELPASDIFHTWEHTGYSNLKAEGNKVVRYARPLLIVTEKLKNSLERLKIKKMSFASVIMHHPSSENL